MGNDLQLKTNNLPVQVVRKWEDGSWARPLLQASSPPLPGCEEAEPLLYVHFVQGLPKGTWGDATPVVTQHRKYNENGGLTCGTVTLCIAMYTMGRKGDSTPLFSCWNRAGVGWYCTETHAEEKRLEVAVPAKRGVTLNNRRG